PDDRHGDARPGGRLVRRPGRPAGGRAHRRRDPAAHPGDRPRRPAPAGGVMLRTTLAGLRAHKLRLVATALAIVLGVGFVAGTLIFGDTAKAALFDQFARAAKNVDVVIGAGSGGQPLPLTGPDTARGVSGV